MFAMVPLSFRSFESDEEQIKGYGKVIKNTKKFSTKYGKHILEVGSPVYDISRVLITWCSWYTFCAVLWVNLFCGTYFLLCLIDHHTDVGCLSPDVVHMVPGPIMPLSLHQHIPGWFPGILLPCQYRLPYMTLSTEYLQVIQRNSVEI